MQEPQELKTQGAGQTAVDPDAAARPSRRALLGAGLGLAAALSGCGGGGGTDEGAGGGGGGSPPIGSGATPSGRLVYRNSGVAAVYNFATAREITFDPGDHPLPDPGMAASRGGIITVAQQGDERNYFLVGTFDLEGRYITSYRVNREFSSQGSAAQYNADGSRVVFSVYEFTSPTDNTFIDRTLVVSVASGQTLASINGLEEPVWAGSNGELIVRDPDDTSLRLFNASYQDQGRISTLKTTLHFGAFDVSRDGRYIAYEMPSGSAIGAYDRHTGASWVAATDGTSSLNAPVFSPDGNFLAMHARDLLIYVPHIVPFAAGLTVEVDIGKRALQTQLADTRGHMGWTT